MLRIKSKVYCMDFWGLDKVSYDNIAIERVGTWEEYRGIRDRISKEGTHFQTGTLTIEAPAEIETIEQAKNYSLDLIDKLHSLLSFAHGHDVPFHELIFYETSNSQEVLVGRESQSIWTGKAGEGSFNVYSHGLERFLATAMPLVSSQEFVSNTNVTQAITYYNFSKSMNFLDIQFVVLWLGLEAMANTFYENNQKDLILTREEWESLKEACKNHLTKLGKEAVFANLLQNISFLRKGTIKERIGYMMSSSEYQMPQYSDEIARMYDEIRVPFFHGYRIDWTVNIDKVYRLERLMEKIIFKTLKFYENNWVYGAIKEDDLSKR